MSCVQRGASCWREGRDEVGRQEGKSQHLWSVERNSHPVGSAPHENQRWRTGGDSGSAETNFQPGIQLFKASLELDSPKPCLVPQSPLEEGRRGEPPPAAPSGWALPSPSQQPEKDFAAVQSNWLGYHQQPGLHNKYLFHFNII